MVAIYPILKMKTNVDYPNMLKVHKNENFFGSDFEICIMSLLVKLKYYGFVNFFLIWPYWGRSIFPLSLRLRGIEFSLVSD